MEWGQRKEWGKLEAPYPPSPLSAPPVQALPLPGPKSRPPMAAGHRRIHPAFDAVPSSRGKPPRPLFIPPPPGFHPNLAGGDREFSYRSAPLIHSSNIQGPENSMQSEGYFSKVDWWGDLRCIGNKFIRGSNFWCCMLRGTVMEDNHPLFPLVDVVVALESMAFV
jgi:hypothetical protein